LAVAVSGIIAIVASEALLSHVSSSVKMEGLERQRGDWARTTFFVDAEVSLKPGSHNRFCTKEHCASGIVQKHEQ